MYKFLDTCTFFSLEIGKEHIDYETASLYLSAGLKYQF